MNSRCRRYETLNTIHKLNCLGCPTVGSVGMNRWNGWIGSHRQVAPGPDGTKPDLSEKPDQR